MKRSLVFSCALLAIGGFWAWQNQKQLENELQQKSRAIAAAAAAGISPEAVQSGTAHYPKRRTLRSENDQVKNLLGKIRALGLDGKDPRSLMDPESEFHKSKKEIREEIEALGSGQLMALIHELLAGSPLGEIERGWMITSFICLTQKDPQQATLQLAENWERLKGIEKMDKVLGLAFLRWSTSDPAKVDDWIQLNRDKIREMANEPTKRSILRGIAMTDPGRAFGLISALQPADLANAISGILMESEIITLDLRDKRVKAWRDYISKLPGPEGEELARSTAGNFAWWASFKGFEKGSKWLGASGYTRDELAAIAGELTLEEIHKEPGRWIDWIGSQLPPEKSAVPIQSLVREWTRADYQAAGSWLIEMPAGPAKNAAIRAYAETVAKADPEVAKQWALTLPPGPEREETLRQIQTK